MKFPIINIADSDFLESKNFDVTYEPTILISKKDLELNYINKTYFDSYGDEYFVKGYTLLKKEWNILFLLQNWFCPLLYVQLLFEKKKGKIDLNSLKSILIEKSAEYWFMTTKEDIVQLEADLAKASTFRLVMNQIAGIINED